jgi:hypothetical protein
MESYKRTFTLCLILVITALHWYEMLSDCRFCPSKLLPAKPLLGLDKRRPTPCSIHLRSGYFGVLSFKMFKSQATPRVAWLTHVIGMGSLSLGWDPMCGFYLMPSSQAVSYSLILWSHLCTLFKAPVLRGKSLPGCMRPSHQNGANKMILCDSCVCYSL